MYDIIIENGTIIDGTGQPMYKADIGVKEKKIAKIGNLQNEKGEIKIDATDQLVCPGFVDVNNHSDTYWQIFSNPDLKSLIYQGITTIIGGNCGSSLAPLADADTISSIQKWANIKQVNLNWLNIEEFLDVVEKRRLSVNFATLVGHGTLRRGVLKDQMRELNDKEETFIEKMLKDALKNGALGMSSGLVYTHARSASINELVSLAKIIKKYDGVYVTHIREEQDNVIEAIQEALKVAEESKVKLHISHLKVMGEKNWHLLDEILFLINKAKENGIDVTFDVFPYTNTGTVLYTLLPFWVSDGGKKMMLNRLCNPQIRAKAVAEMRDSGTDWSKVEIAISGLGKTLAKKAITEIAAAQDKTVENAIIDILIASEGRVITSMDVLSEINVKKELINRLSIVASNGSGYDLDHVKTGELIHPRSFGAFPKVLHDYALGERIISWEEAIMKMTSYPAHKFGIKKRGEIAEGYYADILVINREKIEDLATVDNPYQYSKGIDFSIVNGKLAISGGKYTGIRSGEVIKR